MSELIACLEEGWLWAKGEGGAIHSFDSLSTKVCGQLISEVSPER